MGEAAVAVKLLAVMGAVILLGNLLVGGTNPFDTIHQAVTADPDLPEFVDPFALKDYVAVTFLSVSDSNSSDLAPEFSTVVGDCSLSSSTGYWECLREPDGYNSYILMHPADIIAVMTTDVPPLPADIVVSRTQVRLQYASDVAIRNVSVGLVATITPSVRTFVTLALITLPPTDGIGFAMVEFDTTVRRESRLDFSDLDNQTTIDPDQLFIQFGGTDSIALSYLEMSLYAAGDPECTAPPGAWFPIVDELACQVSQGVDWFITGLQFIVNAFVFGFQWLLGWGLWASNLGQSLIVAAIDVSLWFLELEAPAIVTGTFAIVTFAALFLLLLEFAKLLTGAIPG